MLNKALETIFINAVKINDIVNINLAIEAGVDINCVQESKNALFYMNTTTPEFLKTLDILATSGINLNLKVNNNTILTGLLIYSKDEFYKDQTRYCIMGALYLLSHKNIMIEKDQIRTTKKLWLDNAVTSAYNKQEHIVYAPGGEVYKKAEKSFNVNKTEVCKQVPESFYTMRNRGSHLRSEEIVYPSKF